MCSTGVCPSSTRTRSASIASGTSGSLTSSAATMCTTTFEITPQALSPPNPSLHVHRPVRRHVASRRTPEALAPHLPTLLPARRRHRNVAHIHGEGYAQGCGSPRRHAAARRLRMRTCCRGRVGKRFLEVRVPWRIPPSDVGKRVCPPEGLCFISRIGMPVAGTQRFGSLKDEHGKEPGRH